MTRRGSPEYGQYLKQGQFAARFGPERSTLEAVDSRLRADGLQLSNTPGNDLVVGFSGTTAQASAAFATTFDSYRLHSGRIVRASTSAPALPEALAGSVVAVEGLDGLQHTSPLRVHRLAALASPAAQAVSFKHPSGSPDACPQARAAASRLGGLTDDQIAYAYGALACTALATPGPGCTSAYSRRNPSRAPMSSASTAATSAPRARPR